MERGQMRESVPWAPAKVSLVCRERELAHMHVSAPVSASTPHEKPLQRLSSHLQCLRTETTNGSARTLFVNINTSTTDCARAHAKEHTRRTTRANMHARCIHPPRTQEHPCKRECLSPRQKSCT